MAAENDIRVVHVSGKGSLERELILARGLRNQFYGKRYCGNTNKMEVHDFNYEDRREFACQIDKIIVSGKAKHFTPDTLEQAHKEGFYNCAFCVGVGKK